MGLGLSRGGLEIEAVPARQEDAEVEDWAEAQPEEREHHPPHRHLRQVVEQRAAPVARVHAVCVHGVRVACAWRAPCPLAHRFSLAEATS